MPAHRWGLLTNHALVLIHVIEHPRSTLRDIADAVGITDRAALSLLRALEEDAIVSRRRDGRRNVYTVNIDVLSRTAFGYDSEELVASAVDGLVDVGPIRGNVTRITRWANPAAFGGPVSTRTRYQDDGRVSMEWSARAVEAGTIRPRPAGTSTIQGAVVRARPRRGHASRSRSLATARPT